MWNKCWASLFDIAEKPLHPRSSLQFPQCISHWLDYVSQPNNSCLLCLSGQGSAVLLPFSRGSRESRKHAQAVSSDLLMLSTITLEHSNKYCIIKSISTAFLLSQTMGDFSFFFTNTGRYRIDLAVTFFVLFLGVATNVSIQIHSRRSVSECGGGDRDVYCSTQLCCIRIWLQFSFSRAQK